MLRKLFPLAKLIDRGFPEYDYPEKATDPNALNYIGLCPLAAGWDWQLNGCALARLRRSLRSARPRGYRTIAPCASWPATGRSGSGKAKRLRSAFSRRSAIPFRPRTTAPSRCGSAYGKFAYFTGGDLNCDTNYGQQPWLDIESAAAKDLRAGERLHLRPSRLFRRDRARDGARPASADLGAAKLARFASGAFRAGQSL
jgi:hypothetical protein